jgi:hypothetical protein
VRPGALGFALALAAAGATTLAQAQPRPVHPAPPPPASSAPAPAPARAPGAELRPSDLRARFGTDVASRLMRSTDPEERLRGLERAAATHTQEALAQLEAAAKVGAAGGLDSRTLLEGVAAKDPRGLLVVVRGLAQWSDRELARAALSAIVAAGTPAFQTRVPSVTSRDPAADEAEGAARVLLAREEAAMALAASGNTLALEGLMREVRAGGAGQAPALDALAVYPPSAPLLGGVMLTTPAMIELAVDVGDLRALDSIRGALRASDPALRAAALAALGSAGDARTAEAAREALKDRDPRVRLAGADALVRLGAPDAGQAVEGLVADDATARDALRLAQDVQAEGVTKAAAARAAASADPETRAAAVAALGRQTSGAAVTALMTLVGDARLAGNVADALARSPGAGAMGALESLGVGQATRRLAGRAYLVRRLSRGERSARLDGLLAVLAASGDAVDRAVGVEALVALGERPLERALADRDARVRRAAAMGARAGRQDGAAALLAALAVEPDETTRQVLALGLADGDAQAAVSTLALLERAQAGAADAPLAALALARRADDELASKVDALLASRDPLVRAHVARGLGASAARDATGRLARAYAFEGDVGVRRALVAALATREGDAASPARRDALALAARLDPDRVVRAAASRAVSGTPPARTARARSREVAWLRLVPAEGAALPRDMVGTLVAADGLAVPIAFDDDGYALVPGLTPGEARLRLAPRLPAYEAASP